MKRILFIKSSLNGARGVSSELGAELATTLRAAEPGSTVTTIDLNDPPLPHLGAEEFRAWAVPGAARTSDQAALAARSDRLIEQLQAHDTLVLGVPMYNMTIPSTLKAWIDRIARAGRTFRYTADGPEGLLRGIDAYVVFARGGRYRGTPMDTQTGYIEAILGLVGINDVKTVFAEGLAMGEEHRLAGLDGARSEIAALAGQPQHEVSYASA